MSAPQNRDPERPTALVTGANRGLGLETAKKLAERGYAVLLASRDPQKGEAAAEKLRHERLDVRHANLDVAGPASVNALAKQLAAEAVALDVLVNNAGISLKGFDLEVVRRTLAVNFYGALALTDALLPALRANANVVMVSSGLGEVASLSQALQRRFLDPNLHRAGLLALIDAFVRDVELGRHEASGWPSSAYRVSKIGLNALTRLYARELAPRGIHVNAVCPGWVRTDMGGPHAARSVTQGADSIVWAATLDAHGPTGGFFRDGHASSW